MGLENNNHEHLSNFFEEQEIVELQEKNPEKYNLLIEKVHLITQTQERIAKLKAELDGEPPLNLEEKVDRVLGLIDEAEKEQGPLSMDKLKKEAKDAMKQVGDKAEEEAMGFFEKNVPGLGKFMSMFKKAFDTYEKKGFWAGLVTFFTLLTGKEEEIKEEAKGEEIATNGEGGEEKTKAENQDNTEDEVAPKLNPEGIDKKRMFYYNSGIGTIVHLAGSDIEFGESKKQSFQKFNKFSLNELSQIKHKKEIEIDGETHIINDIDRKIIKSILGEDAGILLKSSLKPEIINKTLEDNESTLKDLLGNEYDIIQKAINEKNLDYKDISLNAISILTLLSINSFGLLALDGVKDKIEDIKDYYNGSSIEVDEIVKDIESRKNNLISSNLIKAFKGKFDILNFGGNNVIKNDPNLRDELNLNDEDLKNELEKLIEFKNWLLIEFSKENSKSLLHKFGKVEIFKENIDYIGVIALYTILGGKQNLNKISTFDYPILYKTISFILGRENPAAGTSYLADVLKYFSTDNNNEAIFKDTNDKEALKIITQRLGKDYLNFILREIKSNLGIVHLFDNELENDVMAIAGGFLSKGVGQRLINKGAIMGGSSLKKFGYLAIFAGLASAIHTTYNNGAELFKELSKFHSDKSFDKMTDDEIKDLSNKAEEFNNKLVPREVEVNGNKEKILLYAGNNGLEMIHNNNIYKLGVGFKRFGTAENIAKDLVNNLGEYTSGFLDFIKQELPSEYANKIAEYQDETQDWSNKKTFDFKGTDYDFSLVKIEGDKVIIGTETILEYDLNILITRFIESEVFHPEKIVGEEKIEAISYRIIEEGYSDDANLIMLKQGEIKTKKA